MNILNLTIKRRWFDMIASGEKREEYRSLDNRQVAKAYKCVADGWPREGAAMVLRNGYRMDSPALAVRVIGFSVRLGAIHPEWGEPNCPHRTIIFDEIICRGTYADVKRSLGKGDEK